MTDSDDNPLDLPELGGARVATAHGIAAIALSLAMKYHDINTIHEGALYQQYKLEGRNLTELNIDVVFETAIKIEAHLLASSDRIGRLVVDALAQGLEEETREDDGGPDHRS